MNVNTCAIITCQKHVLLIQRALDDEHCPGQWGIPGGSIDPEDANCQANAIREVLEEVGLHIVPTAIRFNNQVDGVLYLVITATLADENDFHKKLTLSEEVNDYQWATLKDFAGKQFTPLTKERLTEVLAEL